MTKPHERGLRHTPSGIHGGYLVDVKTGEDVASVAKDYEEMRPFLAAAPDMARALVLAHKDSDCNCFSAKVGEWHCHIYVALRKAGVIP